MKYEAEGVYCKGYAVFPNETSSPRPCVVIAHAWRGLDAFARSKAQHLAELGYVGFAADLYGDGKCVESNDEAAALMMPLFMNRKTLRGRIVAAYRAAAGEPGVNKNNMGAIGFCFGGLTVIELLRSGVSLKGVISFHGLLGDTLGDDKAHLAPPAAKMHGSMLILHGYRDPLVSQQDILNMQKELTDANVDWQMHIYGNAMHAFTNPHADDTTLGLLYEPSAEKRSMQTMTNFFEEVFE